MTSFKAWLKKNKRPAEWQGTDNKLHFGADISVRALGEWALQQMKEPHNFVKAHKKNETLHWQIAVACLGKKTVRKRLKAAVGVK